jgi:hypothetical protein
MTPGTQQACLETRHVQRIPAPEVTTQPNYSWVHCIQGFHHALINAASLLC